MAITTEDYPLRTVEIDIAKPPTDEIATCIDVWLQLRGNLALPIWPGAEFFMALPPKVLPFTLVADVKQQPLDFIYRYWGSGFTNMHGFDLTRKSSALIKPEKFADIVFQFQKEVVTRKGPLLYAGETPSKGKVVISEYVLRIPMSSDGNIVDKVVSIAWMNMSEAKDWFKDDY